MDARSFENLRSLFDRVKNAGFFERLFFWRSFIALSHDAFGEYQQLRGALQVQEEKVRELSEQNRAASRDLENLRVQFVQVQQDVASERAQVKAVSERIAEKERERATLAEAQANSENEVVRLKGEMVMLGAKNEDLLRRINERENEAGGLIAADRKNRELIQKLSSESAALSAKTDQINQQYTEAKETLAKLRQADEERVREHDRRVAELSELRRQLAEDRLRVQAERENEIRAELAELEQSWKKHEETVESSLRGICQRHTLEYCDKEKFPYSGKPDNAVMIFDQYVIFDAKSPKNPGELTNFPQYIRTQAEAAKKYLRGTDVRKEIFLVVPANTVAYLDDFHYDLADLQVYVVTHDCLEPIILALRKIEDYEFADKLSPEERDNICRVIGKFAHATKRRIQIDNFFSNEFIELLQSCENLPEEIKQKVMEIEIAEKMNPPQEKRKKKIPLYELENNVKKIGRSAEAREIDVTAVTKDKIEKITLHKYLE
jgi:hypothetical protein